MSISRIQKIVGFLTVLLFAVPALSVSQSTLQKDYSLVMEIPSVITMESSQAHMYILSKNEGMAVFRTHSDSLQWLYSSSGMEQRGHTITADVRFAYLFGNSRRLTVLDPTSVLGVYSSTLLPERPLATKRLGADLYIALGPEGLGRLSLESPTSVDSAVTFIRQGNIGDKNIIDLEAGPSQLFALSSDQKLFVFTEQKNQLDLNKELTLLRDIKRLYITGNTLLGSDAGGGIYEIDASGNLAQLGEVGEPVTKIKRWKNMLVIQGESNRVWISYKDRSPVLWKNDSEAGNHFTTARNDLWLCEYNQISRVITGDSVQISPQPTGKPAASSAQTLSLKPIGDFTVPYPKPVLFDLQLENSFPIQKVQFNYQSDVDNAKIKGAGFYWQPRANDVGNHTFTIIASSSDGQIDSTQFNVEVQSFNTPPRFAPIRPITIPVGEPFSLPVKAVDPDGMNRDLVRYLGIDLPDGAAVNEKSGVFSWTPTARQTGQNRFQVIATDQYGAAASVDIAIRVIETKNEDNSGEQNR